MLVIISDIIDLPRSDYRLIPNIRPQSKPGDKIGEEQGLKDYTIKISDKVGKLFSLKDMVNLPLKKFYKKRKDATVVSKFGMGLWVDHVSCLKGDKDV